VDIQGEMPLETNQPHVVKTIATSSKHVTFCKVGPCKEPCFGKPCFNNRDS